MKLLACPFCGGEAELTGSWRDQNKFVRCRGCGAKGPTGQEAPAVAEAWNRRAPVVAWKPGNLVAVDMTTVVDGVRKP